MGPLPPFGMIDGRHHGRYPRKNIFFLSFLGNSLCIVCAISFLIIEIFIFYF